MVSLPGSHSAWWYGRAIRVYFIFSMVISATWVLRVLYTASPQPPGAIPYTPGGQHMEDSLEAIGEPPPQAALDGDSDRWSTMVDEPALQLTEPSRNYMHAFTDHIYCLNERNKLGRKGRMTELFKYLHLDVEMFSTKRVSHLDAWRDMINRGYESALIVEDDVDFELDAILVISKALDTLSATTTNWDILYAGHCSMDEGQGKAKGGNERVRRSTRPFCTSGYILSRRGAQKLFSYFIKKEPSTSLDVSMVALVKRKLIKSFSLYPPVVFQRRDLYPSDDGMKLKVARLMKNSAWDMAVAFVPRLANWTDPLDREYLDPAYKHIPSWMEDIKAASF
ncbi:hypothetical protein GQ54DRAFT_175715 [Martensiomyces pterosporus]|nr:hypothetical protein GQ54DRAFT_175715 [Martensiomyces pterosporus]